MSELDANVIVNGQKAIATVAQTGTVIEDGGAIDATSVIQTESGPQKVVKTYDLNGGGGGGGSATWGDISGTLSDQTDLQTALDTKLQNTATGTNSLTILGKVSTYEKTVNIGDNSECYNVYAVSIGENARANMYSVAIGRASYANGNNAIAIGSYGCQASQSQAVAIGGYETKATAQSAIQLGQGSNNVANQFQVYEYPMLDGNTGKIPSDRMTKVIELTTTSVELASDNIYNGAELASVTFTLPATVPVNFTAQLNFTSGATATVLTAPNTINFDGDDCSGGVFTPVASKRYQVLIDSDGVNVNGYVIGR